MSIRNVKNKKYLVLHTCIETNTSIYHTHILDYSIEIGKLQHLDTLSTPNIKLSTYFNDKKYRNYADLILLTEKK